MRFQFNTKYIIDTFINAHNWITIIFIGNLDGIVIEFLIKKVIIRMIVMIVYYLVGIIIFGLAIYVASNLMAISKSRLDVRK